MTDLAPRRTGSRRVPAIVAATVVSATAGLWVVNPNTTRVPLCPLHAATGWWCPLCGGLRATHALAHGDLLTALHDNALFVASVPLLVAGWFFWVSTAGAVRPRRPASRRLLWAALAIAMIFGVVRNLAWGSWLAPPA